MSKASAFFGKHRHNRKAKATKKNPDLSAFNDGPTSSRNSAGSQIGDDPFEEMNDAKLLEQERQKLEDMENEFGLLGHLTIEQEMNHERQTTLVQELEKKSQSQMTEFENNFKQRNYELSLDSSIADESHGFAPSPSVTGTSYTIQAFKFLEANGYDDEMFKSVYYHGPLFIKDKDNKDKFSLQVYCVISYQAILYVCPLIDTVKAPKKKSKKMPLMTIKLIGGRASKSGQYIKITERMISLKSIYRDTITYLKDMTFLEHEFYASNPYFAEQWENKFEHAIKMGNQQGNYLRISHCLNVTIHNLVTPNSSSRTAEAYTGIYFDDTEVARTACVKYVKGEVNWSQSFVFEDLSPALQSVVFKIFKNSQFKSDKKVGTVELGLDALRQTASDKQKKAGAQWFEIESGKLLLKPQFAFQKILPLPFYNDISLILLDLISGELTENVTRLTEFFDCIKDEKSQDKQLLGIALCRFYMAHNKHVKFLQSLGVMEANSCTAAATLFRGNSMFTKSLEYFENFIANTYLKNTIQDIIVNICRQDLSCEVDSSLLQKGENLEKNWERLKGYFSELCDSIFKSITSIPIEIRTILSIVRDYSLKTLSQLETDNVQKQSSSLRDSSISVKSNSQYLQSVSGFIFLRFFSAALVSPSLSPYNLLDELPSSTNKRTLTLLSKTMQKASNLANFQETEAYMLPMNEYFQSERIFEKMTLCLYKASSVKQTELLPKIEYEIDSSKVLSQIHRIYVNFSLNNNNSPLVNKIVESVSWEKTKFGEPLPQILLDIS